MVNDDDDDDDAGVGVGSEFAVKNCLYSPREPRCRDRGCWRRWRSRFPFRVVFWLLLLLLLLSFRSRCLLRGHR